MLRNRRIKLKLFIEDIEFPITSVSVNTNARLTAEITTLSTKEALDIKSGCKVIVAFYDPHVELEDFRKTGTENDLYSVLFIGQVQNVIIDRQANARTLRLGCAGHDTVLNRAYLYTFRTSSDILSINSAFVGATRIGTEVSQGELDFVKIVQQYFGEDTPPRTPGLAHAKSPLSGIIKLIEHTMGYALEENSDSKEPMPASNSFFASESEHKHLLNQIGAISIDNFVSKMVQDRLSQSAVMSKSASALPETATLFTFIQLILKQLFYSLYPLGCPRAPTTQEYTNVLNFVMTPMLFFSTPPKCNVLFPNQISSYNVVNTRYSNPTRLLLSINKTELSQGSTTSGVTESKQDTKIVTTRYYAPSSDIFSLSQGTNDAPDFKIMPHETHSGVVPVFKVMNYLTAFRSGVADSDTRVQDEMYMRIANFELMQARYMNNTITASGPFNPFVANGFPCAIIDTDRYGSETPTIYSGLLTSTAHSISATNASTSYTLTHVRKLDEVDSIFENASFFNQESGSTLESPTVKVTLDVDSQEDKYLIEIFKRSIRERIVRPVLTVRDQVERGRDSRLVEQWQNVGILSLDEPQTISTKNGTQNAAKPIDRVRSVVEGYARDIGLIGPTAKVQLCDFVTVEETFAYTISTEPKISVDSRVVTSITDPDRLSEYITKSKTDDFIVEGYKKYRVPTVAQLIDYVMEQLRNLKIDIYVSEDALQGQNAAKVLAQEEWFRPTWWGESFSILNIGKDVYQPILGSDSVQSATKVEPDVVALREKVEVPLVSTRASVVDLLNKYDGLRSEENRDLYVERITRRPIATLTDIYGPNGLYGQKRSAVLVRKQDLCPPEKRTLVSNETKQPDFIPSQIREEKLESVKRYRDSLRKDAFK